MNVYLYITYYRKKLASKLEEYLTYFANCNFQIISLYTFCEDKIVTVRLHNSTRCRFQGIFAHINMYEYNYEFLLAIKQIKNKNVI